MTYTIKINEITEGGDSENLIMVQCEMNANSDEAAAQVMSDLLLSVARHNHIPADNLNTNLYKIQWINGI